MALDTLLVPPPGHTPTESELSRNGSSNGSHPAQPPAPAPGLPATTCVSCGYPMAPGQEWCLNCGAGAPGTLGSGHPGWRSAALVLGVTAALVIAAAAVGYAALTTKHHHAPRMLALAHATTAPGTTTAPGATTTAPPTSTPPTSTPSGTPPPAPAGKGAAGAGNPLFGGGSSSAEPPPPPPAETPAGAGPEPSASPPESGSGESGAGSGEGGGLFGEGSPGKSGSKEKGSAGSGEGEGSAGGEGSSGSGKGNEGAASHPAPMVLDTNAASTYNPYDYPATRFGDPSMAIDGDATTSWTAQVDPAQAPKLAEGLLIDLHSGQKVGSLSIVTPTVGMVVQVFATNSTTLPTSITDPGWVKLSNARTLRKKKVTLKLLHPAKKFRQLVIWTSKAPDSSAASPGHVAIAEVFLYPPR